MRLTCVSWACHLVRRWVVLGFLGCVAQGGERLVFSTCESPTTSSTRNYPIIDYDRWRRRGRCDDSSSFIRSIYNRHCIGASRTRSCGINLIPTLISRRLPVGIAHKTRPRQRVMARDEKDATATMRALATNGMGTQATSGAQRTPSVRHCCSLKSSLICHIPYHISKAIR